MNGVQFVMLLINEPMHFKYLHSPLGKYDQFKAASTDWHIAEADAAPDDSQDLER